MPSIMLLCVHHKAITASENSIWIISILTNRPSFITNGKAVSFSYPFPSVYPYQSPCSGLLQIFDKLVYFCHLKITQTWLCRGFPCLLQVARKRSSKVFMFNSLQNVYIQCMSQVIWVIDFNSNFITDMWHNKAI